jgi:heme exporter protein D
VPGLVMLYLHLLKQRRKVLGKVGDKKKEWFIYIYI